MRIAIIGAGSMGGLFGGILACVADVWLIDEWQEHVDAIRREGLHLVEAAGEFAIKVPATTNPADVGQVDLAIVFVKSYRTPWAAEVAAKILGPDGLALTLQNGLGNGEVLAGVLGPDRVWQGVTSHGATLLGPGKVRHAGTGPTYLQLRPEIAERAQEVADLFQKAQLEVHLVEDLDTLVWSKLVVNVGLNALTAILRVPNGALNEIPAAREIVAAVVDEAVAVAKAKGIALPYEDAVQQTIDVAVATGPNRSSMLQDVLRGSRTEVAVINGAIVREAAKVGLTAPANALVVKIVEAIEGSYSLRIA